MAQRYKLGEIGVAHSSTPPVQRESLPKSSGGPNTRGLRHQNKVGCEWQLQSFPNFPQSVRKGIDQTIVVERCRRDAQQLAAARHGWVVDRLDVNAEPLQEER